MQIWAGRGRLPRLPPPGERFSMSYADRKQRQIGRLRRLLDAAIETKNISGGIQISKLIIALEGWSSFPKDEPQEAAQQAADLSSLLEHLKDTDTGKTNG